MNTDKDKYTQSLTSKSCKPQEPKHSAPPAYACCDPVASVLDPVPAPSNVLSMAASHVSQVASLSLGVLAMDKRADIDYESCCPICAKTGLTEVASYFYRSGMKDRSCGIDTSCGLKLRGLVEKGLENEYQQCLLATQAETYTSTLKALKVLQTHLRFRTTEIVQAVILFDELWKKHWKCGTFILLRGSMKSAFFVCLLIAHKQNSDHTFKNKMMAEAFQLPLLTLNEFERTILALLDYSVTVNEATYHYYLMALSTNADPSNQITNSSKPLTEGTGDFAVNTQLSSSSSIPKKSSSTSSLSVSCTDSSNNSNTTNSAALSTKSDTNSTNLSTLKGEQCEVTPNTSPSRTPNPSPCSNSVLGSGSITSNVVECSVAGKNSQ
ncbi:uncharacterized protein MONOS_6990 [Monocercomonoides exilis]|uniref:uncharacterized protein n=1 Tax=Monocercomonoides exilis TaxID=2049356 RepID=UPI003559FB34|nr:hypothetical protein MONOS_6990 [Monocercomonoides exilis]|eukprot:MONOS_6990.1-p1 / transcript=MONOS_6990.1 / gene=MONOS_6990 / organism=Monocercomonoides_exilis_PA203 / gene_product=unspecified product / transcript_product=unspecified product / location=Mono_scaffold00230:28674-29816(-) / protein_length=380 / sequence_SO=supercontig / SO=protein_coding / is_pseudo=false